MINSKSLSTLLADRQAETVYKQLFFNPKSVLMVSDAHLLNLKRIAVNKIDLSVPKKAGL